MKYNLNIKTNRISYIQSKGFTLVEALIAISILMIAVASTMSISQRSLMSSILSRNQMTASFLAQDALETVKNIRDQVAVRNIYPTKPTNPPHPYWLSGLEGCICTTGRCNFGLPTNTQGFDYCTIDTTPNSPIVNNSTGTIPPLRMTNTPNSPDGIFLKYDYTGSTPSIFYRVVNIQVPAIPNGQYGSNPNEAIVNVRVFWNSQSSLQSVDIKDFLYNYN